MIESRPVLSFSDLDGEGGGEEEGAGWSSGYMMKPLLPEEDPAEKDSLRAGEGPTLNLSVVVNLEVDAFPRWRHHPEHKDQTLPCEPGATGAPGFAEKVCEGHCQERVGMSHSWVTIPHRMALPHNCCVSLEKPGHLSRFHCSPLLIPALSHRRGDDVK